MILLRCLQLLKIFFNINPFLITPPYEHGVVNLKPIKDLKSACFDKKDKDLLLVHSIT